MAWILITSKKGDEGALSRYTSRLLGMGALRWDDGGRSPRMLSSVTTSLGHSEGRHASLYPFQEQLVYGTNELCKWLIGGNGRIHVLDYHTFFIQTITP